MKGINFIKLNTMDKEEEFKQLVASFVFSFEMVFDMDWEHTLIMLNSEQVEFSIQNDGTFIYPKIGDLDNNWHSRGPLIREYYALRDFLKEENICAEGFSYIDNDAEHTTDQ